LQRATIESLPNEVLLEVFHFHLIEIDEEEGPWEPRWWWHTLVHVCRRWRCVVFDAPLRLDLELYCTWKTPVRRLLHIWPELPLAVCCPWCEEDKSDNVIAALEHRDRVRVIELSDLSSATFERITTATVMQESFPALTDLDLRSISGALPVPDTFLNGSAPSLQCLFLHGISFPSLPRLISSATHLTTLYLCGIPNTGYISPESMATSLSALTMLETLVIEFQSPTPHPKRRSRPRPPPTRAVLPALTLLYFKGVSEWLEVLAARIDAPLLHNIQVTFFNQLVFDIEQIVRFNGHMELPRPSKLTLSFGPSHMATIHCSWPHEASADDEVSLWWRVLCEALDWQVYSVAQLCTQMLPLCSSVDELNISYGSWNGHDPPLGIRPNDMDPARWLELFHSFTSVQSLAIPAKLEPFIAAALQGLTEESAAEVLPTLNKLSINGPTTDKDALQGIESFLTARQHSHHPVAVDRAEYKASAAAAP
jgi:hypothetical protein